MMIYFIRYFFSFKIIIIIIMKRVSKVVHNVMMKKGHGQMKMRIWDYKFNKYHTLRNFSIHISIPLTRA